MVKKGIKRQATVKGNKIVAKWNGRYFEVLFTDSDRTYSPMTANTIYGVGSIAFEMADNNDIGRELSRKIVTSLRSLVTK